jgi:hypothetical protein
LNNMEITFINNIPNTKCLFQWINVFEFEKKWV